MLMENVIDWEVLTICIHDFSNMLIERIMFTSHALDFYIQSSRYLNHMLTLISYVTKICIFNVTITLIMYNNYTIFMRNIKYCKKISCVFLFSLKVFKNKF